jgi:hypothetical protein
MPGVWFRSKSELGHSEIQLGGVRGAQSRRACAVGFRATFPICPRQARPSPSTRSTPRCRRHDFARRDRWRHGRASRRYVRCLGLPRERRRHVSPQGAHAHRRIQFFSTPPPLADQQRRDGAGEAEHQDAGSCDGDQVDRRVVVKVKAHGNLPRTNAVIQSAIASRVPAPKPLPWFKKAV